MASKEEIQKRNIEEANQALGEQLNLVSQLNDKMIDLTKTLKEKGTLDKLSATAVKDVVAATKNLKSEYDSVKNVQKDIAKNEKLSNDLIKQGNALKTAGGDELEKEVKMLRIKENSLTKAQTKLAKMNQQKALGKKVDEVLLKQAEATVLKKQTQLDLTIETLSAEAEQLVYIQDAEKANAANAEHLAEQLKRQENLEKAGGRTVKNTAAFGKIFNKLGASGIGKVFEKASKSAADFAYEATNGGKNTISTFGKIKIAAKGIGAALKAALSPMAIVLTLVGGAVKLFQKQKERLKEGVELANKQAQATADMGRNLGVSSAKAAELAAQASAIGGSMGMVSSEAKQSAGEILSSIGGVEKLTNDTMQTFMKLKKFAGMTAGDIKNIYTLSKLTGQEAGKVAQEMGAQAQQSIKSLKLNVSMKQLMSDVGKVSANVKINFGGSAKAITAAVAQAKKLGLEMNQIEGIASSLLNIEDSIAAEMEAELLTGKDLNLEKARLAALNGDQVALMDALAEQGINEAEYSKMNVLQRESLAKAMGMTKDQMDSMLITQKENTASNQEQVDFQQKGIDAMTNAATILEARAAKEEQLKGIGKEQTENMNKLIEAGLKLKETLQPLVDAIFEPILELVTDIATFISDNLGGSIQEVSDGSGKVLRDFSNLKPIIKAIAVTYGLIKGYQAAITLKKKVEMGYDKIKKSDTLFFARYRMMEFKDTLALNAKKLAFYVKEKAQLLANKAIQAASFLKNVGIAAMKAISSLASIPVVGWGLGIAAAASVAALAAKYMNDGIQGPVTGGKPGYSRTMFGPEGAISFNDKDTIVAGTNLDGGGGNSGGGNSAELGRIANLLEKLLNKEGGVYIDGNKVGSTIALTNYEQQ